LPGVVLAQVRAVDWLGQGAPQQVFALEKGRPWRALLELGLVETSSYRDSLELMGCW